LSAVFGRTRWLFHRLRNMSLAEMLHRAVEVARKQRTKRFEQGWSRYESGAGPIPALPGLRARVAGCPAPLRDAIGQAAEAFRAGRFEALGVSWPADAVTMDFPAGLWTLDPRTKSVWPGRGVFCFEVPYRLQGGGTDVKHVWEFGRLQFLPVLAADALLHDSPESQRALVAALDSWYIHNPPYEGVHWAELLNVAIRAINILLALTLAGERLPPPTVARARRLLAAHAHLLSRFPSLHSSANNHLVAEVTAEYLIAIAMPDRLDASATRLRARRILVEEAAKQILPDGSAAEQSPSYGAFTVEFLLLAAVVSEEASDPLPAAVRDRLCAFADAVEWLSGVRGALPSLGDNDEGRVLTLGIHEPLYPLAIAGAVRAANGMPLRAATSPPHDLRQALFGVPVSGATVPAGQRCWRHGGYSVDRRQVSGRQCVMTMDHGPLGYLSIAAHGHADALCVTLEVDGTPLIVDPGTYLYHAGGAWRDWFRSTAAHSTLNLAGSDQSRMAGPFNWLSHASVVLHEWSEGADWFWRAAHDGYIGRYGLTHERTVHAREDGYAITDRLIASGGASKETKALANVVFQFGAGLKLKTVDTTCVVSVNDEELAQLEFDSAGTLVWHEGTENFDGGWVSPRFGIRVPAPRLVWRGPVGVDGAKVRIRLLPRVCSG
jgi:hypothetical protein